MLAYEKSEGGSRSDQSVLPLQLLHRMLVVLAALVVSAATIFLAGCLSAPTRADIHSITIELRPPSPTASKDSTKNAQDEELVSLSAGPRLDTPATQLVRPLERIPERADLWARIARGFSMPVPEDPLIERFASHFAAKEYFVRRESPARRHLHLIAGEIEAEGLPMELALLPFVESSLNPHAVSPAGALGAWQFMPATARYYDLRISRLLDERKNVQAATRAALRYLRRLHEQFGDWPLALAAYNWGEARVARAIARNRASGLATDYLSLRLPPETRNYVPQLFALRALVRDPERYGTQLPVIDDSPYLLAVTIRQDIDVSLAARLAGLSEREFLAFNPAIRPPLVMSAATPQLLLPIDAAERFEAVLPLFQDNLASWSVRTLAEGARVEHLASQYQIRPALLRSVNGIPSGMRLGAGSTILVPAPADKQEAASAAAIAQAALHLIPDVVRVTLRARRGETPRAVAARLGVSLERLRAWNSGLPKRVFSKSTPVVAYLSPEKARHFDEEKADASFVNEAAKRRASASGKTVKDRRT